MIRCFQVKVLLGPVNDSVKWFCGIGLAGNRTIFLEERNLANYTAFVTRSVKVLPGGCTLDDEMSSSLTKTRLAFTSSRYLWH